MLRSLLLIMGGRKELPRKKTYEEVKQKFEEKGYLLLEEDYKNNHTKMEYRCPNHPDKKNLITYHDLNAGCGCKYCAGNNIKYEYKQVKYEFEKRGYKLLENEYKGVHDKMYFQCPNHLNKKLQMTFNQLLKGIKCKYCSGKGSPSVLEVKQLFKKKGYELLSDTYINSKSPLKYICKKHPHEIKEITWDLIKNRNVGCADCGNIKKLKVIKGDNDLATVFPNVSELLKYKKRASDITAFSNKKEIFICDKCGLENIKRVGHVSLNGLACPRCSDGISYPEKLMFSLLKQLNLEFETQKIFEWSKNVFHENGKLNGTKKYDFYIPSLNCVIETHGGQHYKQSFYRSSRRAKSLEEEQENDRLKEKFAKENRIINYVVIDCRKSELDYIKENIIESKLTQLINFNKVNWLRCHEFACGSLVKMACDLWNKDENIIEIANTLKINRSTIVKYLKQGNVCGLCNYDADNEKKKNYRKNMKCVVKLDKHYKYIESFESITLASEYNSVQRKSISAVCNGNRETAGGYIWMYKEDYDKYLEELTNKKLQLT